MNRPEPACEPACEYVLLETETRTLVIASGSRAGYTERIVTKRFIPTGKPEIWTQRQPGGGVRRSLLDVVSVSWRLLPGNRVQQDINATGRTVRTDGRASGVSNRYVAFCDSQPAPQHIADLADTHHPDLTTGQ